MEAEDLIPLIEYAIKQENDDYLFLRWIPYQQEVGFLEFKDQVTESQSNAFKKPEKEILKDVDSIITLFNTGRGED